ncbi:hypothetical protein IMSHALPRED_007258 [Imshaugia aleurites]|uniref:Uncharacterized protein n=1 Tax=Imshaugia aleurites TaxID=172621 RepID=A0A8H3FN25_9LECA|nr:hypothetical protein IMSHALPRED_007258 [Imshaugia aleurites]
MDDQPCPPPMLSPTNSTLRSQDGKPGISQPSIPDRKKRFANQQERKDHYVRLNREKAARNSRSQSAFLPGMNPPQSYMDQGQVAREIDRVEQLHFQQFQQFTHERNAERNAEWNADLEYLRSLQNASNHQRQSILMVPPAMPLGHMQQTNYIPSYPLHHQYGSTPGPYTATPPGNMQQHGYPLHHQCGSTPGPYTAAPSVNMQQPGYSPQYQYSNAGPYFPPQPQPNMHQPYSMGQSYPSQFQSAPKFRHSHNYSSNGLFDPNSVRCQEVDDSSSSTSSVAESNNEKSTERLSSSVSLATGTTVNVQEPALKRKAATEMAVTVKRSKLDQDAEVEAVPNQLECIVNGENPTDTGRTLKQASGDTLAVPPKYQSPVVQDSSQSQDPASNAAEPPKKISTPALESASPAILEPALEIILKHDKSSMQHSFKLDRSPNMKTAALSSLPADGID